MSFILQREKMSHASAQIQSFEAQLLARDAQIATLTQQLGERSDDRYWRGCLETEGRRYQDLMVQYTQKTSELGAAQLKYEQLKERVRRKAAQVGARSAGPAQPSVGRPGASSFVSLDTIEVVGPLGSGAMPQRSAAPEGSFTSRPPLSGQRRRLEDSPRPEEGEGSRQD